MDKNIQNFEKAHRLTNYISLAMLYLKDNYLLERELQKDDIKERILGHWGTVPGLNFLYLLSSIISKDSKNSFMFLAGPGHGAPAILANTWLEKTLGEYYPKYSFSREGLGNLIHDFSWPGGFPSHTSPMVPGTLLEGGELGYSLATAFGIVLDNPNLICVTVIGDGEAETGTLSASWNLSKFINPEIDGSVLPIIHLNGYRISGPTLLSSFSESELNIYFKGLGYEPIFIDQFTSNNIYQEGVLKFREAIQKINKIKNEYKNYSISKIQWPLIIFKSKKGWGAPKIVNNIKIEDSNHSHGIPLQKPKLDTIEFLALKDWLESYEIQSLLDSNSFIKNEILEILPEYQNSLSKNIVAYSPPKILDLPRKEDLMINIFKRGDRNESRMIGLSKYIREIFRDKVNKKNFKIFSPDESESNLLEEILDTTTKKFTSKFLNSNKDFSDSGGIIELLSENVLVAMMQGYNLSGRSGLMISYEAFLNIVSSQLDQHLKYISQSLEVGFRPDYPSLNLVATSTLWRQEHNGYTHQNPTLINSLLSKHEDLVKIYFPSDVNTLIVTLEEVLKSTNKINLIVACKRDLGQFLYPEEAINNIKNGYSVWDWVQNHNNGKYDISLACAGDYQTNESIEAVNLINSIDPDLRIKFINFSELSKLREIFRNEKSALEVFEDSIPIVFNFHGYPSAIKMLSWGTVIEERLEILGYIEKGTTTTPFDMEILNKASRFHTAIKILKLVDEKKYSEDIKKLEDKIEYHNQFIKDKGVDLF